ncbi:MAG TPA: CHRD domain-containing protein [Candidatus Krumholzibacteria bacterium]|nr:CHRD domain-containing protein [Candidatus Krumholzibacteria bacterium]HPD70729.1 CHRD domain-containing protein [Candidatus Krumholzibacteria bacterium]HRY39571.1 CHRD domain-containing protein [Candidatus Krumholzibacteria bacterium]
MVRRLTMGLMLAVLALGSGAALAATVYDAELIPESVQPGSGATAYGQATLIINDSRTLAYLTVNFAGLDTPQTGANLLRAAADAVGVEIIPLPTGTPLALTLDFTTALADALDADELAIQIYSEDWPGGAIRGNFAFVIVGVDAETWTHVKGLFD